MNNITQKFIDVLLDEKNLSSSAFLLTVATALSIYGIVHFDSLAPIFRMAALMFLLILVAVLLMYFYGQKMVNVILRIQNFFRSF